MMPLIIAFVVFIILMALVAWVARRNAPARANRDTDNGFVIGTSAIDGSSAQSSVDCSSSHSVDGGSCGH